MDERKEILAQIGELYLDGEEKQRQLRETEQKINQLKLQLFKLGEPIAELKPDEPEEPEEPEET